MMWRWLIVLWCGIGIRLAASEPEPLRIHVLPLAFSAESRKHYGEWIERLEGEGYGQAIWQELEELLYDVEGLELIQSPMVEDEFMEILRAHLEQASAEDGAAVFELPSQIITLNANVFTREVESLRMMKATRTTQHEVTLYLRFFDLAGGKLNQAIPARGTAAAESPVAAGREAMKHAVESLLSRLQRAGYLGKVDSKS
ncbi:MAG: hypothetical protein SynsKO_28750 [Synoicihabitans sp.]